MNLNLELLEKDVNYGLLKEEEIKIILENYFKNLSTNCEKFKKLSIFHPMDFSFGNYYFEIKSRRCKYNKYKTTMIGFNKIQYANKVYNNKYTIFIFVFEDGIFYYKYNKDDNFETSIGGRTDRGIDEIKLYYYIPIEKLIQINL